MPLLDSLLKDYVYYNLWANTQLINWLKDKPLSQIEVIQPSSFPSIRLTLLHLWDVEDSWLCDLKGNPAPERSLEAIEVSTKTVFEMLLQGSNEFCNYVATLSSITLLETCTYLKYDGTMERKTRVEIIHHCMNHSTFHRGQIITLAHQLGWSNPPSTDLFKFQSANEAINL